MLAWSSRVSSVSTGGDQPPRCIVADTVKSTRAQVAKIAQPSRAVPAGDRATSNAPATSATGAVPACSSPRSRGRASARASTTCSVTVWVTVWVTDWVTVWVTGAAAPLPAAPGVAWLTPRSTHIGTNEANRAPGNLHA
jgi:hypothetical protein